ncbi:MAG: gliding motility-associated C-terminal domain-containing protein [Saprospiraceae bacterium]|nr:gliding motility-associated C-terminal domain-containing protein [Saprospiraceae bacterium]
MIGIQLSGCHENRQGELLFLYTNCGFAVDSLVIELDSTFDTYSSRKDYFINQKNEICGWKEGDLSVFEDCGNLIAAGSGDFIPPRSMVIVQMTADIGPISSLKGECDLDVPIYVIANDCIRTDEAFPINGVRDDTFRLVIRLLPDASWEIGPYYVEYANDKSVFDRPLNLHAVYPGEWSGRFYCDTHHIIDFSRHIKALYPQLTVKQPSCDQGGSIDFGNIQSSRFSIDGGMTWKGDQYFENLDSGGYLPAVWDDQGNCPIVWIDSIYIDAYQTPEFLTIWWQPIPDSTCQGGLAKLYIDFRVGRGLVDTNLYEFSIDSGQTFQDSWIFTNVKDGSYDLAIKEKNNPNCITYHRWESPPLPQVPRIIGLTNDSLSSCNKSLVGIIATGANLLYSLDGINYSPDSLVELEGGQPTMVYVKESGNDLCIDSMELLLTEVAEFIPDILVNGQSAEAFLIVESKGPYTLRWSTGDTSWVVENLPIGLNSLELTDGWGCTNRIEFFVSESSCVFHLTDSIVDATCETPTTSIYLISTDSMNTYQYDWSIDDFDGLPYIEDVPHGIFRVLVSYGDCTKEIEYRTPIGGIKDLKITTNSATCQLETGSFTIEGVVGGTAPYIYDLSQIRFDHFLTVNNLSPGTHSFVIRDVKGCIYTDTVLILADTNSPHLSPEIRISDCQQSLYDIDLSGSSGGRPPYSLILDDLSLSDLMVHDVSSGAHQLQLLDANGCSSGILDLTLDPIPKIDLLDRDTMIVRGSSLPIKITSDLAASDGIFILDPMGDTLCFCTDTILANASEGAYVVGYKATYEGQCLSNDFTWFVYYLEGGIYIPNSFSPNGDGVNDVFQVFAPHHEVIDLQIFNRWGGQIFRATGPEFIWDGRLGGDLVSNSGVFIYRLLLQDSDAKPIQKIGTITVLK